MNKAPAGHPAYLFLLQQWGSRPPCWANVRPDPNGVFVSPALGTFRWLSGTGPEAANDP